MKRKILSTTRVFTKKIFLFSAGLILILSSFLVITTYAASGVPRIMSYQGRLTDSSGNLLGGTGTSYNFRFSLYTASSGGTRVWPSGSGDPCTHSLVVKEGVFNANIGDTSECSDVLDFDFTSRDEVYLQVEVYNSTSSSWEALSPRHRIN